MHLRLSTCLGAAVVDRNSGDVLGLLSGILIHPDTGRIEGIYVRIPGFLRSIELFCVTGDIAHWGVALQVNNSEALAPLEERVRLAPLKEEGRSVLGQKIRTESGRSLGTCADVQFDTERMKLEWLFPRRFFRWGIALPLSEIKEVRRDAIIVREGPKAEEVIETEKEPVAYEAFPEIAEARRSS